MSSSSFYVDLTTMDDSQLDTVRMKKRDSPSIPRHSLLPGEIMVCEIPNVLRFDAMGESKHGISGALCATNFRVSFITTGTQASRRQSIFHSSPDLSETGEGFACMPQSQDAVLIPQACIMYICSVNGDKVKKINPGHVFKSKLQTLVIYCKDFRIISFGFRFCPKENQRKIVNAILHYSYPSVISRLFAFDYIPDSNVRRGDPMPTFRSSSDWVSELRRLNSDDRWRVTEVNMDFGVSESLGKFLVCPKGLKDEAISAAAIHYTNGRLPFWCWNHPVTGVPLLCSIGLPESDLLEKHESFIFDTIKSTYPKGKMTPITIFDVSRHCASPRELEISFEKVKELCMHENEKDFWAGDAHWLTSLDGTRWLHHIRSSLVAAYAVSKLIYSDAKPVVVRELTGRDLSLVITSLAQIVMDRYYRTIKGFQCLVQKMWVIFGHPFAKRVSHIKATKKEEKEEISEAPVFLHFLDCVQQLLVQFPSAFEFSETFLLGLLDCVYSCMFETFLFNCERHRFKISNQEHCSNRLVSLWDYIMDNLPSTDFSLFLNPLYEFQQTGLNAEGTTAAEDAYLVGSTDFPCLKFWASCFLRWLPIANQTVGRGHCPSKHLQQMILMNQLRLLQRQQAVLEAEARGFGSNADDRYSLSSSREQTPPLTPIGDFKASILNSLTGPFSFSEYSLNPLMGSRKGASWDDATQV